ncbi:MAG: PBP1A family penicillin-binding protein [Clostridiales bacterium]|nr:PBP1A family penicillin-binding protein [Clostridiales bacterium]
MGDVQMLRRILLIAITIFILISLSLSIYISLDMREWEVLDPEKLENLNQTSIIYDRDDVKVTDIHGIQNRINISIDEIPEHVKDAFITVEDLRFYNHKGIDIRRMLAALIANIRSGSYAQGASTIAQQVVRNSHLTLKKTMSRKLQEIYLALLLDRKYSKDWILQTYLNIIYFGKGAYGIETASNIYFDKSAKDLSIAEGCLLAGIPKNPSKYSPFAHIDAALNRKDLIIDLMAKHGTLSKEEAIKAKQEDIQFADEEKLNAADVQFGYFIDNVLDETKMHLDISDEELFSGGYRIYTTIDSNLQNIAEDILGNDDFFPKSPKSSKIPEIAVVAIHPKDGEILSLMGGRSYPKGERKVLNRATQSKRQPGSAIKPIIAFAPALEHFEYTTATILDDSPVDIGGYTPSNYGGRYRGLVTVREALAQSINTIAVKILYDIGIDNGIKFAENLGIPLDESDRHNLSIALGGFYEGVTPMQLARAYTCLADSGVYKELSSIRRIEDSHGKTIYEHRPIKRNAVTEETAFLINNMLQSAASWGTASALSDMELPIAAKTGTSQLPNIQEFQNINGVKDAWVVVYNPDIVLCIWMGFDKTTNKDFLPSDAVGGSYTTKIAKEILSRGFKDIKLSGFIRPKHIVETELDAKSLRDWGILSLANPLTPGEYIYREFFTLSTVPTNTTTYWTIPDAPEDFKVYLEGLTAPMLRFTSSSSPSLYEIHRIDRNTNIDIIVDEIITNSKEPVIWFDSTAKSQGIYSYYIIASHPELASQKDPIKGNSTKVINITIPEFN